MQDQDEQDRVFHPTFRNRLAHRLRTVEAACILTIVGLRLKLLPLHGLLCPAQVTGPLSAIPAARPATCPVGIATTHAVDAAARRLPWRPVCLPRALAVNIMLRRRGVASRICLGVAMKAGTIVAHAWVEMDGRYGGLLSGAEGSVGMVPIAMLSRSGATG